MTGCGAAEPTETTAVESSAAAETTARLKALRLLRAPQQTETSAAETTAGRGR